MLDFPILQVAIGMIFIYLLLSTICSAFKEAIAAVFHLRAVTLEKGIEDMFQSPAGKEIKKQLYDHALIRALTQQGKIQAAYLPARTFTLALLDVLAPATADHPLTFNNVRQAIASCPCPDLRQALLPLVDTAGSDLDKVRRAVGTWFDDAMDRVSGWYKVRSQFIISILALLVCTACNIDSIALVNALWRDPSLRTVVVDQAKQSVADQAKTGTAAPAAPGNNQTSLNGTTAYQQLEQLELPVGWSKWQPKNPTVGDVLLKILGLIITVAAVSLNAPFWFDLLNKAVNLRIGGAPPDKASAQPANDAQNTNG